MHERLPQHRALHRLARLGGCGQRRSGPATAAAGEGRARHRQDRAGARGRVRTRPSVSGVARRWCGEWLEGWAALLGRRLGDPGGNGLCGSDHRVQRCCGDGDLAPLPRQVPGAKLGANQALVPSHGCLGLVPLAAPWPRRRQARRRRRRPPSRTRSRPRPVQAGPAPGRHRRQGPWPAAAAVQRRPVQPRRKIAAPTQACLMHGPVRDAAAGARSAVAAGGVVLGRHGRDMPVPPGPG